MRRVCSDQDIPTAMILRLHARIGSMDCENQQSFVQYELPCVRCTEPTSMFHGSHLAPRFEDAYHANFFPMQAVRVNLLQMKSAHWSSWYIAVFTALCGAQWHSLSWNLCSWPNIDFDVVALWLLSDLEGSPCESHSMSWRWFSTTLLSIRRRLASPQLARLTRPRLIFANCVQAEPEYSRSAQA